MATLGKVTIRVLALLALAFGPAATGFCMDIPDSVTLNSLSKFYNGVEFDHAMHLAIADDCAACHHHTTGTPPQEQTCARCHARAEASRVIACRDCHAAAPFSAAYLKAKKEDIQRHHTDQLGLKGAYHQSCIGCHQSMGGPTGCLDCHDRNPSGDELFRAGAFAPQGAPASH